MEGIRMFLFWTDEQFLGALPIMAVGTSTGRPKGFWKLLGKVTGEEREGAWLRLERLINPYEAVLLDLTTKAEEERPEYFLPWDLFRRARRVKESTPIMTGPEPSIGLYL